MHLEYTPSGSSAIRSVSETVNGPFQIARFPNEDILFPFITLRGMGFGASVMGPHRGSRE